MPLTRRHVLIRAKTLLFRLAAPLSVRSAQYDGVTFLGPCLQPFNDLRGCAVRHTRGDAVLWAGSAVIHQCRPLWRHVLPRPLSATLQRPLRSLSSASHQRRVKLFKRRRSQRLHQCRPLWQHDLPRPLSATLQRALLRLPSSASYQGACEIIRTKTLFHRLAQRPSPSVPPILPA